MTADKEHEPWNKHGLRDALFLEEEPKGSREGSPEIGRRHARTLFRPLIGAVRHVI